MAPVDCFSAVVGSLFLISQCSFVRCVSPLVSYDFLREDCLKNLILPTKGTVHTEAYLGALNNTKPGKTLCVHSNGISLQGGETTEKGVGIRSTRNISSLTTTFNSSLTFELWVIVKGHTTTIDADILTIGSWGGNYIGCSFGVKLQQKKRDTDANTMPTFRVRICSDEEKFIIDLPTIDTSFIANQINHLMFCIEYQYLQGSDNRRVEATLRVNGNPTATISRRDHAWKEAHSPSWWQPSFHLWLLTDPDENGVPNWTGTLYKLSIFNASIDDSDVQKLYEDGLVNSLPVVWNETVIIQEDGEVGSHYENPAYYENPIPIAELAQIHFPLFDLEESFFQQEPPYVIFSVLPRRGLLYSPIDFHEITMIGERLLCCSVIYRPKFNQFSSPSSAEFDMFKMFALDGVTNLSSVDVATVSIIVTPVNHPPVPGVISVTAFNGVQTSITLHGSDREDGQHIEGSEILVMPHKGTLLWRQSENSSKVVNQSMFYPGTEFLYKSEISLEGKSDNLDTDWFSFKLFDADNNYSVTANATISIRRAVQLLNNSQHVIQSQYSTFSVLAQDMSNSVQSLCLYIDTKPMFGILIDPYDNSTLESGDTLSQILSRDDYLDNIGFSIAYRSSGYSFSIPTITVDGFHLSNQNDAFDAFAFHCEDEQKSSMSLSAVKSTPIIIRNANDATTIVHQIEAPLTVYPLDGAESDIYPTELTISNLTLIDPDYDVGFVRAEIFTTNRGYITLADVHSIDFISFELCHGQFTWQCLGDGFNDRHLIFVGSPSAVQRAISGMSFSSSSANDIDYINISIYDGVGDLCFTTEQLGQESFQQGCYISSTSIEVHILGYTTPSFLESLGSNSSSLFSMYNIIGLAAVFLCCTCCACACKSPKGSSCFKDEYDIDDSDYDSCDSSESSCDSNSESHWGSSSENSSDNSSESINNGNIYIENVLDDDSDSSSVHDRIDYNSSDKSGQTIAPGINRYGEEPVGRHFGLLHDKNVFGPSQRNHLPADEVNGEDGRQEVCPLHASSCLCEEKRKLFKNHSAFLLDLAQNKGTRHPLKIDIPAPIVGRKKVTGDFDGEPSFFSP